MKRIILCFDGTWNAVGDPNTVTNVVKIANGVAFSAKDGTSQIVYYNSGVGSGGPIDRFLGGVFGAGLRSNVKRGLAFLALNYEQRPDPKDNDEIYIFGFSRGAYTARALAGVVGVAGVPKDIKESERHWDHYRRFSKLKMQAREARAKPEKLSAIKAQMETLTKELRQYTRYAGESIEIKCVGVWDTVGAYGIPMGFGLGGISRMFTYWTRGFRDTEFGKMVQLGLHALAIDERRRPFAPTFWTLGKPVDGQPPPPIDAERVEQMWFAGAHSNVGGGYDDPGLSDLALAWMMARVEKTGLEFNREYIKNEIWPCFAGTLYRADRGGLLSRARTVLPVEPDTLLARLLSTVTAALRLRSRRRKRINESVHWSVLKRRQCPAAIVDGKGVRPYAPRNLAPTIDKVSKPIGIERELMAPDRDWAERCPFKGASACVCRELMREDAAAAA